MIEVGLTCLSYIPELPIPSFFTVVPPLHDGSGRQNRVFVLHSLEKYVSRGP